MKLISRFLVIVIVIFFTYSIKSQIETTNDIHFEVNKVLPAVLISEKALEEVQVLNDLDPNFKSEWIKTYHSVEIITQHNGFQKSAKGKNSNLTLEQKKNLNNADKNEEIIVIIDYMPNNNLSSNEIQKMDFSININPENKATYVGGKKALLQYLKDTAIDRIPQGSYKDYDLSAITFSIDISGQISEVNIVPTKMNKEFVESILYESICNMPDWKPAEYSNGVKVKQEQVLTVGNMQNCIIHTLNILNY